jgi:hypothetical protein
LSLGLPCIAQNQNNSDKKITRAEADSIRTRVMNRELLLNPNEASRFWPVYERELNEIQKLNREYFIWLNQHKNQVDRMSNADLQDFLQKQDDYLQKKLNLRREYDGLFRKILSLRQLAHLYLSEDKFARELVQYRIRKGLSD